MGYRKVVEGRGVAKGSLKKSSGNRVRLWTLGQEVITKELQENSWSVSVFAHTGSERDQQQGDKWGGVG